MNSIEVKVRISELEEENKLLRDKVVILKEEAADAKSTDAEFERVEKELTAMTEKISSYEDDLAHAGDKDDIERAERVLDLADDLHKLFEQVPYSKLARFSLANRVDLVGTLDALNLILEGR